MADNKKNKFKSGLKNVYYAPITEDGSGVITYETPVPVRGAVNLSLKSLVETTDIPADDDPAYATVTENKGYEGDIEFQLIDDEFKVNVLGASLDSNKVLIESKEDKSKPVALLFEFAGDQKAIRHVMYNCLITKPDIESGTKGDKVESKTDKLSIKCRPARDTGNVKVKTNEDTTPTTYTGWFTKVYISGGDM